MTTDRPQGDILDQNKPVNRFHRVDLGQPPKVKVLGFMHFEEGERRWQIPVDHWQLMMPDHGGVIQAGGRVLPFDAGSVLILPPRAAVRLSFDDPSLSGHWHSLFSLAEGTAAPVALATRSDLGSEFHWWRDRFTLLYKWAHVTESHRSAHIWSLLWRIARPVEEIRLHPYIKTAEAKMRERLSEPLRIDELCEELQVSQSHLNRLFQDEYGVGPKRFLLDLRVSRAVNLLRGTTKPLKEIAAMVGIPDMQQFNKTLRESIGMSPTAVRHSHESPSDYAAATPELGLPLDERPVYGRDVIPIDPEPPA
jgi:AraC-like DNA-binding protein